MKKRDIVLTLAVALLSALFLIPTIINTGIYNKLPASLVLVFMILPLASIGAMYIAYLLSKRLSLFLQIARFGLVGILNTAIDFGLLNFLSVATQVTKGVGIIPINAVSVTAAVVNSFFWNKEWVFPTHRHASFAIFATVTVIGLSLNTAIVYALTTYMDPVLVKSDTLWANLAKVLATAVSMIWNFLGYKLIVFKR